MTRIAATSGGLAVLLISTSLQAQDAIVARRIAHIEKELLGPVQISGMAFETHTLAERMAEMHIPGISIAVMHKGRIDWAKGYGVASVGGAAVAPETRFQAGSISKPVAALAALRLVEQGKLSLDADINDSLKSWKLPPGEGANTKPVTLRELLTHTGGTTVHGFPGYAAGDDVPTLVQVLNGEKPANTAPIRIEAPPAEKWNYSGGGYTIMQQAMIDASGEDFPTLLEHSVLAPMGMTHSTYHQPLPDQFRAVAAAPNNDKGEPIKGGAHTYPEMAAAGLWTTPSDILLFAREIQTSLNGKSNHVISAKMARAMVTSGLGGWGLGLKIDGSPDNPRFGHGGDNVGFHGLFFAYEKDGEGAVVMTNGDQGPRLVPEIMRTIAMEYKWPDDRVLLRKAVKIDPAILPRYAGTYAWMPKFDMKITLENGRLLLQTVDSEPVARPAHFPQSPLYAEADKKFFLLDSPAEIEIVTNTAGQTEYLLVHEGGQSRKIMRK
ncbi:MAG: serine hydrolase [Alphaproteobacteria bacterium]|nr:serine hydrolase [Alphaproteobacteria bacterium]